MNTAGAMPTGHLQLLLSVVTVPSLLLKQLLQHQLLWLRQHLLQPQLQRLHQLLLQRPK